MLERGMTSVEQINNNTAAFKYGDNPIAIVTSSEDVYLEEAYQDRIG
jgi:hypothetical protein